MCIVAAARAPNGYTMVRENFIHYRQHILHYVKAGNGKRPLLVFHGFGQDHTLYLPLLQALGRDRTIYIIDLFFHGKSKWGDGERPLSKETWNSIMAAFLRDTGVKSFSILAYSLGGKFALATLEGYPTRVRELFLVAPDGIRPGFWYTLATRWGITRRLFKSMIKHQHRFLWLARKIDALKVMDKSVIRFADFQMATEAKRKRVYYSWVVFRRLTFEPRHIAGIINRENIRLVVVAGRDDRVIPPRRMRLLLRYVNRYQYEVLDSGHTGLVRESLSFLRSET